MIFGSHLEYDQVLQLSGLKKLSDRREEKCLDFALKCTENLKMKKFFVQNLNEKNIRQKEVYKVNFGKTNKLKNSTIPYCQRLLNNHYRGMESANHNLHIQE